MTNNEKARAKAVGRARNVRFDEWIHEEVDLMAIEREITFTDMVNHLLEEELNHLGYTKANYNAKKYNLHRDDAFGQNKKVTPGKGTTVKTPKSYEDTPKEKTG